MGKKRKSKKKNLDMIVGHTYALEHLALSGLTIKKDESCYFYTIFEHEDNGMTYTMRDLGLHKYCLLYTSRRQPTDRDNRNYDT